MWLEKKKILTLKGKKRKRILYIEKTYHKRPYLEKHKEWKN